MDEVLLMRFGVTNDALCGLYERFGLDLDDERDGPVQMLYEETITDDDPEIGVRQFLGNVSLDKVLQCQLFSKEDYNRFLGPPLGLADYLEHLKGEMQDHREDHTRSIEIIDQLIPRTESTEDLVFKGYLGRYQVSWSASPIMRFGTTGMSDAPLSLDKPQDCMNALERIEYGHDSFFEGRVLAVLSRFKGVDWPGIQIEVEPYEEGPVFEPEGTPVP